MEHTAPRFLGEETSERSTGTTPDPPLCHRSKKNEPAKEQVKSDYINASKRNGKCLQNRTPKYRAMATDANCSTRFYTVAQRCARRATKPPVASAGRRVSADYQLFSCEDGQHQSGSVPNRTRASTCSPSLSNIRVSCPISRSVFFRTSDHHRGHLTRG